MLAYVLGFIGLGLLLTALYKLLPEPHIVPHRALGGDFVAAALWQGVLQTMVWYLEELSLGDSVYSPLAAAVVLLLGLEAGAAIVLLGAQVIAELKHSAARGLAWHEAPARRHGG